MPEIKPGETVEVKVQYPPVSAKEEIQIIDRLAGKIVKEGEREVYMYTMGK